MPSSFLSPPRVAIGAVAAVSVLGVAAVLAGLNSPGGPDSPAPPPAAATVTLTVPPSYTIPGTPPVLPWPAQGQAAVEVVGVGSLGSSGAQKRVPIASVAKVMTAYVVLVDHPLAQGAEGATLTVSAAEAAEYPAQVAAHQSLVKVTAGEVLTERQALTALLLPSADNVAQILARWDAGDAAAFVARMNATAARFGMADTRYTDPSGLDHGTVSTAADQVKLAERAMAVPALAEIVALPRATIPVAGVVTNYNTLLGQDGIVGVKTGSTAAAGGCLVFAARFPVGGRELMVLGVVLGQAGPLPTLLPAVLAASRKLVRAARAAVGQHVLIHAGAMVGTVGRTRFGVTRDLTVPGWPGLVVPVTAHVSTAAVGSLEAGGGSVPVAAVG